jgi:N-acetylneuraminate synthase
MDTLAAAFGLPVGFSDHTPGIAVAIAAVARGASVIEKHLTLDSGMEGPDHKASLEPASFAAMVDGIREVEHALGDGRKVPAPSEVKNMAIARKCLVAARDLAAGEVFTAADIAVKRAGAGRSPFDYWDVIGSTATRPYIEDEPI